MSDKDKLELDYKKCLELCKPLEKEINKVLDKLIEDSCKVKLERGN